jgi:hypothetical protein
MSPYFDIKKQELKVNKHLEELNDQINRNTYMPLFEKELIISRLKMQTSNKTFTQQMMEELAKSLTKNPDKKIDPPDYQETIKLCEDVANILY